MNNTQTEEYMQYLAQTYSITSKNHMNLISGYINGLLTYDEFKPFDKAYVERLDQLQENITEFLRIKNTL